MKPPLPLDEAARLEALRRYEILDTGSGKKFAGLTGSGTAGGMQRTLRFRPRI